MKRATAGLTILELVFALAILSVIMMGLASVITTSQRTTSFTRERSLAANAINAYVASMRGKSMTALLADTTTPADFLPSSSSLRDAQGNVVKINYENGSQGVSVTGGRGTVNTTTSAGFNQAAALGFTSGGRDLDGDGALNGNPVSGTLLMVPAQVTLSWTSAVGGTQKLVVYALFTP